MSELKRASHRVEIAFQVMHGSSENLPNRTRRALHEVKLMRQVAESALLISVPRSDDFDLMGEINQMHRMLESLNHDLDTADDPSEVFRHARLSEAEVALRRIRHYLRTADDVSMPSAPLVGAGRP